LVRRSVVLAAALSCSVIGAAAVGALTAPMVLTAIVLAIAVGFVSAHEQGFTTPFSAAPAPPTTAVVIDAPRARESHAA
jgi:hypothetical protein